MKIVSLTPGTGSFHCGSCIRDNALVLALRERGHDTLMIPLYLPFVTEKDSSAGVPVFLGGINSYLQQKSVIFRLMPKWLTKVFDAPFLLKKVSKYAGMTSAKDLGEMSLSMLKGKQGFQKNEVKYLINFIKNTEKPDVILISNVLLTGLVKPLKEAIPCKVVVTLQGEDTFLNSLPMPFREECWRLVEKNCREADFFIPVSQYHKNIMNKELHIPEEKIRVVYNGLNLEKFKMAKFPENPPVLGMLSRLIPGKGVEILTEAFIYLRREQLLPNLKLKIAGSKTAAEDLFIEKIKEKLLAAGLLDEVEFFFNVSEEEKIKFLENLTIFSTPAEYGESFGLYVLEAIASGLPVVQPDNAVFPELLGYLDCGQLYQTGEVKSLAEKILFVAKNLAQERERSRQAAERVKKEFSANFMAKNVEEILVKILN